MLHFTLTTRKMLADCLKQKQKYRGIAVILKKSVSSISDEINRNGGWLNYDPFEAEARALQHKHQRHKRSKLEISPGLKRFVIDHIREEWSPENISGFLAQKAGKNVISFETIYQFIYSEKGKSLGLYKHLRHRKEPSRIHQGIRKAQASKRAIPDRTHISLRDPGALERSRPGHFEVDLMIFSHTKQVMAVFVDRCTRKTWIYMNPDKTAAVMLDTMREFVCDVGIANVKSLSFDNGTENFYHYKLKYEFPDLKTFFCDPYCSWQKGTVENTNKLLRQYFPRTIDPLNLNFFSLKNALHKLNNRPRKCLLFRSPNFCSV